MKARNGIWRMAGMTAATVVITALLTSSAPGLAQSSKAGPPDGARLYRVYCASCHGPTGRGDGPVAEFLNIPPSDLTQIANRAKGVFPADEVFRIIDGRKRVRAHGDSAMPVWGDGFSHLISVDGQAVRARLDALVKYLEAIQARRASSTGGLPAIAQ
jgi:mono/diheme cytochrome c family protein